MPDRLPPFSEENEAATLGCILDCDNPNDLFHKLSLDYFYDHRHRTIYESLQSIVISGTPISMVALGEYLTTHKLIHKCGGFEYFSTLPEKKHSTAHFQEYHSILKEFAARRAAIRDAAEIESIAFNLSSPWKSVRDAAARMSEAYAKQKQEETPIVARPIGQLQAPIKDDPSELLKYRFLSQCGSLLIAGPTGMGKSSFLMQCLALWVNNKPAFDIHPTRCLRSLIIQAENDDGDIAEMRDGVCRGVQFTEFERMKFFEDVKVFTSNGLTGKRFCDEVCRPLLDTYRPDLLAIDPALAFLGGDFKEQRDVSDFLRSRLNPLLLEFKTACVLVHHANKPKKDDNWTNGESAYMGGGSAEWANWARATLSLQSKGDGFYSLKAGKRWNRIGWKDDQENTTSERLIVHSKEKGVICWHWGSEEDMPDKGRPKAYSDTELLALLDTRSLSSQEWQVMAKEELGLSESTFHRARRELASSNRIMKSQINGKWTLISKQ